MTVVKKCLRCRKPTPMSKAGADNLAGRICLKCWDEMSQMEVIRFGSMLIAPAPKEERRQGQGREEMDDLPAQFRLAAQDEEIAGLRRRQGEYQSELCAKGELLCQAERDRDAARAQVAEVRKSRDGFARSFLSIRALLLEGALDMMSANDRDYESFQQKVGWAIKESKPAEAEARRALEEGK